MAVFSKPLLYSYIAQRIAVSKNRDIMMAATIEAIPLKAHNGKYYCFKHCDFITVALNMQHQWLHN